MAIAYISCVLLLLPAIGMLILGGDTFPGKDTGKLNQVHVRELAISTTREEQMNSVGKTSIDRREPPDTRRGPDINARAPLPDMWTATTEARGWMDEVQREVNLRGSYTRFSRGSFSE
ncbi:hypothetical protein IWW34DRAFT_791688 [Fusarium oxysporum f. sp. albedinis]|nr:hypothetical protein IWW34DRAFT_791688 [Fusarium oxysporum f. sp. albedinis]